MNNLITRRDNLKKKNYEKDFEFLLNDTQKKHLINKSNDLSVSGGEYMRLLIDQDMLLEELSSIKDKNNELIEKLAVIQYRLNRYRNKK